MAQRNAKAKRSAVKQKPSRRKQAKQAGPHDHLPFFSKDKETGDVSWWRVEPTGDWQSDLATGKEYARIFSPSLHTIAGGPTLAWIVDGMVKAAQPHDTHSRLIDGIASGFLMELVSIFQQAHRAVITAGIAVDNPSGPIAAYFKSARADGTLLHEQTFAMLEINKPQKKSDCWDGVAVGGMTQYEWFYWPESETLRVRRFVVQPNQPLCEGQWMEQAPVPDELRRDVKLAVLFKQAGVTP